MKSDHNRHKAQPCPYCNYTLNVCTKIEDENVKPAEGDYSICFNCASFLMFDGELALITMSAEDIGDMDDENRTTLARARKAILKTQDNKNEQ